MESESPLRLDVTRRVFPITVPPLIRRRQTATTGTGCGLRANPALTQHGIDGRYHKIARLECPETSGPLTGHLSRRWASSRGTTGSTMTHACHTTVLRSTCRRGTVGTGTDRDPEKLPSTGTVSPTSPKPAPDCCSRTSGPQHNSFRAFADAPRFLERASSVAISGRSPPAHTQSRCGTRTNANVETRLVLTGVTATTPCIAACWNGATTATMTVDHACGAAMVGRRTDLWIRHLDGCCACSALRIHACGGQISRDPSAPTRSCSTSGSDGRLAARYPRMIRSRFGDAAHKP